MPSLTLHFLTLLQDDYTKYPCFIETGTNNGNTTLALESFFKKVYTIEISESHYLRAKQRYRGNKIQFILGDSAVELGRLLPSITDKCIFFLDGHWSSCDTGKGDKDCPLYEEVTHINALLKTEAILIIDDFRLFGKGKHTGLNEDWSDINKETLLAILQPRIQKVYHLDSDMAKDDRLIIHIGAL